MWTAVGGRLGVGMEDAGQVVDVRIAGVGVGVGSVVTEIGTNEVYFHIVWTGD